MLRALIQFSLQFKGVVVALACLLVGYGTYVAMRAKLDVFPNFVQPQVVVQTEAPGLAPEQVETLVTRVVETAVMGLGNQEAVRSESIQGLSIVTVVFKENTDVFLARQMLAEKLSEITGQFPVGVKTPRMTALTSSTMDLLKIGLLSETLSPMELRAFADWVLKPRLLGVPGVARCNMFGGEVRQLQIRVRSDRLIAYDLSVSDVLAAARTATAVMGAGYIETANQRITIQTEGQSLTPEQLGNIILLPTTNGPPIRLRDVANVLEGAEPKFGDCLIQGKPGVLMTMSSQYGANTMEVTRALESALAEMKPAFASEGIKLLDRLHRPATFIEVSLRNINHSLLLGGILVAVVLFFFLGHFRTAFISLTAIPLSLLTAIILLDRFGLTLNTITLGGLAIAIGEVVDDAIIDVENIFRRLRENQLLSAPRPVFNVVLDASIEVRSAVVYATFIVALVFLPVLTMTGLQGRFFAPLALSYLLAIGASLAVALTVTPALSFLFFGKGVRSVEEPRLQRKFKGAYRAVLTRVANWPGAIILVMILIVAIALLKAPSLGGEFLPEFREGHFVLQITSASGMSLPEALRLGGRISEALLQSPHIATVEQQIGRAELGEDTWGPNRSEFHVELKPVGAEDEEKVQDDIRKTLASFPGIQFEVLTFLGDRISETIAGETAPVVISIFGDDLDQLDAKAKEVAAVIGAVPGAADVQVKSPPGEPRLAIKLRPDRLTQFGYHPVDLLGAIQTAFQGTIVAQTYQGNRVYDVAVILDSSARHDPESIAQLQFRGASGMRLPLHELADIYLTSGRSSILHEGARRRQTVTCNAAGRDIGSFVRDAKKAIAQKVQFDRGVYPVFTGAAEAAAAARRELLMNSAIAAVGIILLLVIVLGTARNLFLILTNVPFALIGGLAAIWISQLLGKSTSGLSIGALVGFVTLFGITMRNSIMLISHFEHLVKFEGMTWNREAALRGASERLIPIMMTALVAALGLLPLALGAGEAGREIEGPMAIVILGGLLTSTLLNLLFLPALALRFGRFSAA
ncbi:MAG TPA: efflux RND transporter permease subunit [Verrucomicrobiae bacterium]|nr:efflux RND transporter permease subunit [Verrucomicrobiae bacterium]